MEGEYAHIARETMDETAKKEALRLFSYGLYAISCGDDRERNAFTANWLTQVSFDPPMVVLSVENDSVSLPIIRRTRCFGVNVYAADQRDLAGKLGKSLAKHPDKLAGLRWSQEPGECPILLDCPASVACEVESELPAGDSTLVLARVVDAHVRERTEPLTMLAAGFKHAG